MPASPLELGAPRVCNSLGKRFAEHGIEPHRLDTGSSRTDWWTRAPAKHLVDVETSLGLLRELGHQSSVIGSPLAVLPYDVSAISAHQYAQGSVAIMRILQ